MQPVKFHPPVIDAITVCLKAIFEEQKVADKVVNFYLKEHKLFGSRDRSMIAETAYDIVRWKLKYQYLLATYSEQLTKYKHLILISLLNRNYNINNIDTFEVTEADINQLKEIIKQPIAEKHIDQSYPETFYTFCTESIGERWHQLAAALNKMPGIFIRVNTLKTTRDELLKLLEKEEIAIQIPSLPLTTNESYTTIQILSKNNLKNNTLYKQGFFEFQDIGSQAIGRFAADAIAETTGLKSIRILDMCAGAGGKTLQLSCLLKNQGKIFATDYNPSRIKQLAYRAAQAGCKNIEITDYNEAKKMNEFDIILIDAPCSGSGTFKRQPDLKYKITPEKIQEYQLIQASLLESCKNKLRKNGKIIYATCSVLPEENELQLRHFLTENTGFTLINAMQLSPTQYEGDGFFMAEIAKKSMEG
ncbi:MAG: RsmB/NOP family class I SAM-dependent RNA methyltransferase [Sphingobacteriales bacterium]|nr:RsmB/NOP family class I SAM-dependent RNA methyltransferase [Sphingobacteriales bacterium]